MAVPPKDLLEDTMTKSAPFSYAQAAKGKAPVPLKATTQEQEPLSWADDSYDADTVVDEPLHPSAVDSMETSGMIKSRLETPGVLPSKDLDTPSTEQKTNGYALDSPSCESSDTTMKNDDSSSPSRSTIDSPSDATSQTETPSDLKSREASSSRKDSIAESSRKGSASDPARLFKDAPPPTTNVWAARAEKQKFEAANKVKTVSPSQPTKQATGPSPNASTTAEKRTSQSAQPRSINGGQTQSGRGGSVQSRNGTSRPTVMDHTRSNGANNEPPPPAGDEFAWPTPLSAKDEAQRTHSSKPTKPDSGRSAVPSSMPHSKDRWQTVEFTPSVVFPTAAIPQGGRGVRPGVQGGTGGVAKKRLPRHLIADGPNGDSINLSKGVPTSVDAKHTSHTDKNFVDAPNNQRTDNTRSRRQSSVQGASAADATITRLHSATADPANTASPTIHSSPNRADVVDSAQQDSSLQTVVDTHQESGRASLAERRKNAYSETGRGGFDTSRRGKRSPNDSWTRAESQGAEGQPPIQSTPRGRGRGRGDRGRGRGEFSGSAYTHQSSYTGLPALQTNYSGSHHRGGPSISSGFSASPGQERNPGRGGMHRGSLYDGPHSRHLTNFSTHTPYAMYSSQLYEYGMAPGMPYHPQHMEHIAVCNQVATQLSYYFSLENMLKDMFLRKQMDSQGFVPLSLIANFKRIKDLTPDFELIKSVCMHWSELELRSQHDGHVKVRLARDWEKWVLPVEDRDPSAQNDGPVQQHYPNFQPQSVMRSPMPYTNGVHREVNGSGEPSSVQKTPTYTPTTEFFPSKASNGISRSSNRHSVSVLNGSIPSFEPQQQQAAHAPDGRDRADEDFSDTQIPTLMLAVKRLGKTPTPQRPQVANASRTFSNGSMEDGIRTVKDGQRSRSQGPRSDPQPDNSTQPKSKTSSELYWLKEDDSKACELPMNGDSEPYLNVLSRAMDTRRNKAQDECPHELQVLYQFWSHFLIRHFNHTMYDEFRRLAHDDHERGSDIGMKHLLAYYHQALSNNRIINDRVARHYIKLVQNEDRSKDARPAFDQLKRAWLNGATNVQNRKKIMKHIADDLRAELDR